MNHMRIARLIYTVQMPVSKIHGAGLYTHVVPHLSYHHAARTVVQHSVFSRCMYPAELSKNLSNSSVLYQHLLTLQPNQNHEFVLCSIVCLPLPDCKRDTYHEYALTLCNLTFFKVTMNNLSYLRIQ